VGCPRGRVLKGHGRPDRRAFEQPQERRAAWLPPCNRSGTRTGRPCDHVETVFAKLAKRRLKRGVFPSVVALQQAINRFVAAHNRDPKPFVWQADPKAIIAAAKRGYQALDSIH